MVESHEFFFRPIVNSDLEFFNIVRNFSAPFLHNQNIFSLQETIEWFRNKPKSEYWLILLNGNRIGYFRLFYTSTQSIQIGADLHPDFIGRGIGRKAYINFAKNILVKKNVKHCTLKVLKTNLRAYHFYKKLGFKEINKSISDFEMGISVVDLISLE